MGSIYKGMRTGGINIRIEMIFPKGRYIVVCKDHDTLKYQKCYHAAKRNNMLHYIVLYKKPKKFLFHIIIGKEIVQRSYSRDVYFLTEGTHKHNYWCTI